MQRLVFIDVAGKDVRTGRSGHSGQHGQGRIVQLHNMGVAGLGLFNHPDAGCQVQRAPQHALRFRPPRSGQQHYLDARDSQLVRVFGHCFKQWRDVGLLELGQVLQVFLELLHPSGGIAGLGNDLPLARRSKNHAQQHQMAVGRAGRQLLRNGDVVGLDLAHRNVIEPLALEVFQHVHAHLGFIRLG